MYGVVLALTTSKSDSTTTTKQVDDWIHANKVCRHTLLNVLSNDLFDVMLLIRMQKIFGIHLSSNILPKTSSDKGS